MAVRKFNYTGRKRILWKDVKLFIHSESNGTHTFDANLNLNPYELPRDAAVVIEAYRQTTWMRFSCGTVNNVMMPDSRELSEFDSPEVILFRVKVISGDHPRGKLLAMADQIHPQRIEGEDKHISLLPVKPCDEIKEIYRISFSGPKPVLEINSRTGDWRSLAKSPGFISLAYPSSLREILNRILYIEKVFDIDDLSDWRCQWLFFSKRLPGIESLPDNQEKDIIDDWIDEVATAFCRKFNIMEYFNRHWF